MGRMHIRDALEADLPAILDIYNHAVLHSTATADLMPQSLDARQAWFRARVDDGLPVLVAEEEGVIVCSNVVEVGDLRAGTSFAVGWRCPTGAWGTPLGSPVPSPVPGEVVVPWDVVVPGKVGAPGACVPVEVMPACAEALPARKVMSATRRIARRISMLQSPRPTVHR